VIVPALLLSVALSQNVNWAVGAYVDVRARSGVTGLDTNSSVAGDVGLGLSGQLGLTYGGWSFSAAYTPVFRLREPYAGLVTLKTLQPDGTVTTTHPQLHYDYTNRFNASAEWRRDGRPHPYVRYSFNSGILDLSTLTIPPGGSVPTAPVNGANVINLIGSDTTAGVDWPLSPLVTLTTEGGYYWGGGADLFSAQTLPLQSSPRGLVRLAWTNTPVDRIELSLNGRYALFGILQNATATTPAEFALQRVALGTLGVTWFHQLGPHTGFDANLGGSFVWGQAPPVGNASAVTTTEAVPSGGAGVSHAMVWRDQTLSVRAQASVGPFIDPYVGTVYERVEGSLGLGLQTGQHLNFWARGGSSRSLAGGAFDIRSNYGDAGAGWVGAPWWRVDLSSRVSYYYQGVAPKVAGGGPNPMGGGANLPTVSGGATTWVVSLALTLTQRSE